MSNVLPMPGVEASAEQLVMPAHFKAKGGAKLRAAWDDLIASTAAVLHVKQNRFTFEIAATLLAKFRSGESMTATESKELKKHMVALGLAKDDDAGKRKRSKNDDYFE